MNGVKLQDSVTRSSSRSTFIKQVDNDSSHLPSVRPGAVCCFWIANSRKTCHSILLRSSWQTVNIGDIAHTPGMLALLERHRPNAEVTLWPSGVDRGVAEILMKRFPS